MLPPAPRQSLRTPRPPMNPINLQQIAVDAMRARGLLT